MNLLRNKNKTWDNSESLNQEAQANLAAEMGRKVWVWVKDSNKLPLRAILISLGLFLTNIYGSPTSETPLRSNWKRRAVKSESKDSWFPAISDWADFDRFADEGAKREQSAIKRKKMPHGINYNPLKSFNMFSQPPESPIQKTRIQIRWHKKAQISKYASDSEQWFAKKRANSKAKCRFFACAQVELEVP